MSSSGTWSEPPGDDLESSPPRSPIPQDTSIHVGFRSFLDFLSCNVMASPDTPDAITHESWYY